MAILSICQRFVLLGLSGIGILEPRRVPPWLFMVVPVSALVMNLHALAQPSSNWKETRGRPLAFVGLAIALFGAGFNLPLLLTLRR